MRKENKIISVSLLCLFCVNANGTYISEKPKLKYKNPNKPNDMNVNEKRSLTENKGLLAFQFFSKQIQNAIRSIDEIKIHKDFELYFELYKKSSDGEKQKVKELYDEFFEKVSDLGQIINGTRPPLSSVQKVQSPSHSLPPPPSDMSTLGTSPIFSGHGENVLKNDRHPGTPSSNSNQEGRFTSKTNHSQNMTPLSNQKMPSHPSLIKTGTLKSKAEPNIGTVKQRSNDMANANLQ